MKIDVEDEDATNTLSKILSSISPPSLFIPSAPPPLPSMLTDKKLILILDSLKRHQPAHCTLIRTPIEQNIFLIFIPET